ncbi:MAG: AAA family ATPase [Spirochaetes bacterium]|jgi:ATP-dependent Clp protease ATP-binding subunit ClpX|nr:AAA family ATPase [Spirochaetota bacterium]
MSVSSSDSQKKFDEFFQSMESDIFANSDSVHKEEGPPVTESNFTFDFKPEELETHLNKYVVGQEHSIEVIATKVCTHFNRMKLEQSLPEDERVAGSIKSNILLIGPTGVGKTYIIKLIADKIGVPFVKADATKFSETGYVGGDVEDLVRELVHEADEDIAKAEYGIIYLDEVDKIASSSTGHSIDVSRSGVQRNLLKLMEEADVDLKTPHDLASQVEAAMEAQRTGHVKRKKINTKNILFICSGAFSGLKDIIKKRMNFQAIGFDSLDKEHHNYSESLILGETRTEDLLEYGFESEFIGRLPVTVVLNDVDEEVLYQILKNKYSTVVNGKKLDFRAYGIALSFTDGALRLLAKRAAAEHTGARGLLSVFEKVLIKYEKIMPSLHYTELLVNSEMVENPERKLKELLINDNIKGFRADFFAAHNIYLEFEDDALELIQKRANVEHKSFKAICEDLFHDYAYAIKLLKQEKFTITAAAVEDSAGYIERYIRENFKETHTQSESENQT